MEPTPKVPRIGIYRCSVFSLVVKSGTRKIGHCLKLGSVVAFKKRGMLFVRNMRGFYFVCMCVWCFDFFYVSLSQYVCYTSTRLDSFNVNKIHFCPCFVSRILKMRCTFFLKLLKTKRIHQQCCRIRKRRSDCLYFAPKPVQDCTGLQTRQGLIILWYNITFNDLKQPQLQ